MLLLANHWANQGIRVELLLGYRRGPYQSLVGPRLEVSEFQRPVKSLLPAVVNHVRRTRPQILLSTLQSTNVVAGLASPIIGRHIKVVLREANSPSHKLNSATKWSDRLIYGPLSRMAYPLAHGLVSVSESLREEMLDFYRIRPNRLTTIYNPVLSEELFRQANTPINHPALHGNLPIVMAVGRVAPQKDFVTLLKAFAQARQSASCRLVILGDTELEPDYYAQLVALTKELGITDVVYFVGFQDNPFAFLAQADVFVLSSRFEGLPGVLIQAMALGCRLVSTDCPHGPAEILEQGRYGELVPVGDEQAMSRAIVRSLREPDAWPGREERSRAFSLEVAAEAYLRFFEGLVR